MARFALLVLACTAFVALHPAGATAQATCHLDDSGAVTVQNRGTPYEMAYLGRPVLSCTNGLRITADSAVSASSVGEIQFIGNVRLVDPERRLNAQYAQYIRDLRQLAAMGDVVLVDRRNGSTIRAPALDYLMESPERPEPRIDVHHGRPRTLLVSGEGAGQDTTVVDSDALSIFGERLFQARGQVELRRGTMDGSAQLLEFEQEIGRMQLSGEARLYTAEQRLHGDTIIALLENDSLREVTAAGRARLLGEDLEVKAPRIWIGFADGLLDRLTAAGERTAESDAQPRVTSPEFVMEADSIDVRAPAQKLERVVAVGSAFGERLPTAADSLRREALETLPEIVRNDWMRGDTIIATFIDGPASAEPAAEPSAGQTARDGRALETLTVFGTDARPARSVYRVIDAEDPTGEGFTINYMLANEIRVTFENGEAKRVEAEGNIRGVYLRPDAGAAPRPVGPGGAARAP